MPVVDSAHRTIDFIEELDEDLAIEGSRRRRRRMKRRAARRGRRSQRKENRRVMRQGKRASRMDRQDRRQDGRDALQDRRIARREEYKVTEDEANPERARQPVAKYQPPEAELEPASYEDEVYYDDELYDSPEEELDEIIDEDAYDIVDVSEAMAEQAVLSGAGHQLARIRHQVTEGRLPPRKAHARAKAVHQATVSVLRRQGQAGPARRAAIKRKMKQRMESETSGFSGPLGCSACTEAYRRARLAGVQLAGQQAMADLSGGIEGEGDELGFLKKAAKGVGKGISNLLNQLDRNPTKVAERRERRAGKAAQGALKAHGRATDARARADQWGVDQQVGTDLVMRTVHGKEGLVLDLQPGLWLVASAVPGAFHRDPAGVRRNMLRTGQDLIQAKLSPLAGMR